MSANIESFAGRAPAWHRLGYVFDESEQSDTVTMLKQARLANWNVRAVPLTALVDGVEVPVEAQLILRDSPVEDGVLDALSVMGGRYATIQNEDVFELGEALVSGGAQWDTAGSLNGGRVVFGAYRLPRDIVIDAFGANDTIKTYMTVASSHDGSMPTMGFNTDIRVVCQNTLNMAVKGAPQAFKIRHTKSADERMAEAAQAFRNAYAYADALEAEAKALYETSLTNAQFNDIIVDLYPKPESDSKAALTRWENKVMLLGDVFAGQGEGGNTVENIAGTAWAGLNALTEYMDWYRQPRGGGDGIAIGAAGFTPAVNAEKNRIRSRVLEFAGL